MPKFEIPCTWMMSGAYHVEAETLEDAIAKVETENLPLPTERQYVSDSLRLDPIDEIRETNALPPIGA